MFRQCLHAGFHGTHREDTTKHILIANKVPSAAHIVVPFILISGMYIENVLYFVSQMCTSGTIQIHTNRVSTVAENVMGGHRLITFKI